MCLALYAQALPFTLHQFWVGRMRTPAPRQSVGVERRSRMHAWRLCPGRALGKSSCLPRRLHKQMNITKKPFEYRCVFFYNCSFRSLPLPGICRFFLSFHLCISEWHPFLNVCTSPFLTVACPPVDSCRDSWQNYWSRLSIWSIAVGTVIAWPLQRAWCRHNDAWLRMKPKCKWSFHSVHM